MGKRGRRSNCALFDLLLRCLNASFNPSEGLCRHQIKTLTNLAFCVNVRYSSLLLSLFLPLCSLLCFYPRGPLRSYCSSSLSSPIWFHLFLFRSLCVSIPLAVFLFILVVIHLSVPLEPVPIFPLIFNTLFVL